MRMQLRATCRELLPDALLHGTLSCVLHPDCVGPDALEWSHSAVFDSQDSRAGIRGAVSAMAQARHADAACCVQPAAESIKHHQPTHGTVMVLRKGCQAGLNLRYRS
jgi:hypothetical protein